MRYNLNIQYFGGRGQAGGIAVPSGKRGKTGESKTFSKTIENAKNYTDLDITLMQKGMTVLGSKLGDVKFEQARDAIQGGIYALEQLGVKDDFSKICGTYNSGDHGVMCASYDRQIMFNPKYFKNYGKENGLEIWKREMQTDFHPANNSFFSTGAHEMAHQLERYIAERNNSYDFMKKLENWNKHYMASSIIHDAFEKVKKEDGKSALRIGQYIRQVSGYATENKGEAFAECICDYIQNGSNAQKLSIAVWNRTKDIITEINRSKDYKEWSGGK